ncbi:MAG: hypothetical protein ACK46Y_02520 [Fluviicola sp.]
MKRVFLAWLFTLLIGSFLFGVIATFENERIEISIGAGIVLISFILSAVNSIPLLITELIASNLILKQSRNFSKFSTIKYFVAGLTVMIFILGTSSQKNEDLLFRIGGFLIAICYGIPGYILHIKYIKPIFFKENKSVSIENEDLLDT